MFEPGMKILGESRPDNLESGLFPILTDNVLIEKGQNLKRGAVLGKNGSGNYALSTKDATDGCETPVAILAHDIDAKEANKLAVIYITGMFNSAALTYGKGHTLQTIKEPLHLRSIFIQPSLGDY